MNDNESAISHLSNREINIICEQISSEYEKGKILEDASEMIKTPIDLIAQEDIRKEINSATISELRAKYINKNETFEDPAAEHAPCGMPGIPSMNFAEKNEDIAIDPAMNTASDALPAIASDILNSGLELK